jgi:HlyD family type I secretion membrane fusion protein
MSTPNLPATIQPRALVRKREAEQHDELFETLSAFESETTAVLAKTAPKNERVILYILMIMVVAAVALSAVVKLDRVVTGVGEVVSVGGPLYVSPLNAGVVRDVRVKAGDIVKKGDVLATLDPTLTNADVVQLQQRYDSDSALIERLSAEHEDKAYEPTGTNPYNEVQLSIWKQRHAEYESNVSTADSQAMGQQSILNQYLRDAEQYRKRLDLAQEREKMYDPLAKKGYVSQLQLNSLRDATEEADRIHSQAQNQIAAQRQALAVVRSQKSAFVEKWHGDVGAQLVAARNEFDGVGEQLAKAKKLLELGTLAAPADAIVLKVGKVSSGSIAGQTSDASNPQLFTLAPLDAPLEAEIRVPAAQIGFIRDGDPVTVKFDAYSFIRHGTAKGEIKSISEGSFTLDDNNVPVPAYFKVRVAITDAKLRDVPKDFRLIPGMTVVGDTMVGRRTILSYLVEGALRTGSEAMREAD